MDKVLIQLEVLIQSDLSAFLMYAATFANVRELIVNSLTDHFSFSL